MTPIQFVCKVNLTLTLTLTLILTLTQFVCKGIRSPASWASGLFDIRTVNAFDAAFDVTPANVSVVPASGTLYSVELLLPQAGRSGPINVSFATVGSVLHAGKIKVKLPLGSFSRSRLLLILNS